jgi:uncharacterized protein (DUF1501 family)
MISRRHFLTQGLSVVSLGVALPGVFAKAALAAAAEGSAGSKRTLVVVQLAGGVDGLASVIPYSDPAYRDARAGFSVAEEEMIVVDKRVAFHPSLAALKALLDAGKLAVVEGVGYANPTFSHFKAMDIWQSGDPDARASEGWLGKYFESLTDAQGHPLAGLSVGRSLPAAFASDRATLPSVDSLETFGLQGPEGSESRHMSLMRLYDIYRPARTPFAALLDTTLDNAMTSSVALAAAHAAYTPAVAYPESSLASGLRLLAELIDASSEETPLRVGHVTLGGFDTHTQQPGPLANLLTQTSEAISAFWQDIVAHGHADDVLVMTWSEFGRRVTPNAQDGTDHGWAGPMFLIGNGVMPGFHGEPPSLTNLVDGNLRYTVDFRSVYATVLERWLEAPAEAILGGRFDQLKLLAA